MTDYRLTLTLTGEGKDGYDAFRSAWERWRKLDPAYVWQELRPECEEV